MSFNIKNTIQYLLFFLSDIVFSKQSKLNLIFIMFDDLRPELNAYGAKHMITPSFDRLAKKSVLFENAFAQISVCCPSRVSLLTGLRPDSTGVYNFEKSIGAHTTLTDVIGSHGYNTAGYGRIFIIYLLLN